MEIQLLNTKTQGGKLYLVMREINRIILHCSATPEGRDIDASTIRMWHTANPPVGRGWSDIGYHYVIKLDGTIEGGRPIHKAGAHCKGHNQDSIGICYIGGMDDDMQPKDTMNECQEAAFKELIYSLRMVWDKHLTLHGHNEFSEKACPSFKVSEKFPNHL